MQVDPQSLNPCFHGSAVLVFFFFNLGKIAAYLYIVQTILWLEKTNEI